MLLLRQNKYLGIQQAQETILYYWQIKIKLVPTMSLENELKIETKQHQYKNLLSWRKKQINHEQENQVQKIIILSNGQGLYYKHQTNKILLQKFIYSKMIGVNSSSKNITEFVSQPYLIDKFSCAYAIQSKFVAYNQQNSNQNGIKQLNRLYQDLLYKTYKYLVEKKSFYLIDGHKFGGDFLAYELNPDSNHSVFIVFVNTVQRQYSMEHISRLAGVCKKIALLIDVNMNQQMEYQIAQSQVQPKKIIENRKIATVQGTKELFQLKKLIGYKF